MHCLCLPSTRILQFLHVRSWRRYDTPCTFDTRYTVGLTSLQAGRHCADRVNTRATSEQDRLCIARS
jgi:hypothetical protein